MTNNQTYYLGMALSYILGAIITPFFFLFIAVVRIALCIVGIVYDTFMFTPRVVTAWQERHWQNLAKSAMDKAHLN